MAQIYSVADLLKKHAETRGQQIAFSSAGHNVTYTELATRTGQIAVNLVGAGVTRGSRVAVVLGSCIEAIESIFAITRAAAVGVPLDPRASQAELARILENSEAHVVITDSHRFNRVCAAISSGKTKINTKTTVVVVNKEPGLADPRESVEVEGLTAERYENWFTHTLNPASEQQKPLDDLSLDEPAWLHYTTGTTGYPKGVLSCQRAWMWSAVNSYIPSLGLASTDKIFWPLPLFHAFGQSLCIIGTLAVGASTHLIGDESLLDSLRLRPETTIIAGAPTSFRELTQHSAQEALAFIKPRACVNAGAAAPAGLSTQVEKFLGVPLINHYGCTECGLIATTGPGDRYPEEFCGPVVKGIDVQVRGLSRDGQVSAEVVDGGEGEICVRTPSFMLGYNDSKFPLSKIEDGWYRTGDLGCLTETGPDAGQRILTVTGRLKELIIRGGENIHPGEVERAVRAAAGVADVVVTGLPHDVLGEVPAAFIVAEPHVELDMTKLLKTCRAVLPDYKVPVSFYTIEAIPVTASGKPKRIAALDLLNTDGACRLLATPFLGRDTIGPLVLAECIAVCGSGIGLDNIDPEESFMSLGLNSMKSVVLRDRLASLTGLDLPITFAFDNPTPAAASQYFYDRLFGTQQQDDAAVPQAPNEADGRDPIAIVSMDCRYPGGISSADDLWCAVSDGLDLTSDFPTNRDWDIDALYNPDPDKAGTCVARRGGFLHDMADFDAEFFGMSPREALATDPQQRLLLETTYSLIERAGIAPSSLRGTSTSVFIGMIYADYASRFNHGKGEGHEYEAHLDIGSSPSVAAGRISYTFDFKGPSMAIDAACSSSLSAIHLAVASLQTGESTLAIAGGATIMSTPRQFIAFSRQRGLSTDGRCRPYSADANGTGWSEGVGLVLLERLSDARRNGHTVHSIIRGSAVNSDGSSFGLTVPSGQAQQEVIKQTLRRAALSPADVDVLDGHGTATMLGDPIEMRAVLEVYGDKARSTPLLVGSVKSNIGHTQAAAGIASVIKMVKSMEHGIAPASLNVSQPTPHVDWTSGAVELLTKAKKWPSTPDDRPRRAAVSSFGISGTNAHVILEHAGFNKQDQEDCVRVQSANVYPWLLSGADGKALQTRARSMATLCHTKDALDVAFSLAVTRSPLSHRAAVTATSDEELHEALMALAEGRPHLSVSTGMAKASKSGRSQSQSRLAFLFSGQGSQRIGMGQKLCARFPQFDAAFREVCKELDQRLDRPLSEVIDSSFEANPSNGMCLLDRADFAQAAVFSFEVAMYRLLESFGIRPDYVAGHSLGEIAAAHAAGYLSLADAATLVTARGSLMAGLPEGGAMVSISATEKEVNGVIRYMNLEATTVAAINTPDSVVVSGPAESALFVKGLFAAQGRSTTQLRVSHAFHSPMMAPTLDSLRAAISHISPLPNSGSPKIPLVSTLTGKLVEARELTAEHWIQHIISPVRFADALRTLSADASVTTFVEIGPSAPLSSYVPDAIATSRSKQNEVDVLLKSLGQLWVRGIQPSAGTSGQEWKPVFDGSGARKTDLPVYPFQRRTYWLKAPSPAPISTLGSEHQSSKPAPPASPASSVPSASPKCAPLELSEPESSSSRPETPATEVSVGMGWEDQLSQVPAEKRRAMLVEMVQDEVSVTLGYPDRHSLSPSAWSTSFVGLGCDSYMGTMLRGRLAQLVAVQLPIDLIFNEATSTVQSLIDYLFGQIVL
ncbi:polyketide synthase type 1 [Penicillium canariense]|uniref:Polyketide synthase type 1 n=1 Tax=Penicillium canariense TaxID=189055 RepID=A0A9W9LJI4_9EURO|nr:polyketide synthase type 1 [Penicillium canariense]KAJ5160055.1 polyketide synthase type 1 [Penicillium canariense]